MGNFSYCKMHDTFPQDDEPCWACINQFGDKIPDAEVENRQNTKPCRVDGKTPCVQYPEEKCGCDFCETCTIKSAYLEKVKNEN